MTRKSEVAGGRLASKGQLSDEDVGALSDVARVGVANHSRDPRMIARLACEDPSANVRLRAVRRVTHLDLLDRIIANEMDEAVLRAAQSERTPLVRRAIDATDDQATLARLAISEAEWSVRARAVKRLNDVGVVERIANEDEEEWVRNAARDRSKVLRGDRGHESGAGGCLRWRQADYSTNSSWNRRCLMPSGYRTRWIRRSNAPLAPL